MNKHLTRFLWGFTLAIGLFMYIGLVYLFFAVVELTYEYWHIARWFWYTIGAAGVMYLIGYIMEVLE